MKPHLLQLLQRLSSLASQRLGPVQLLVQHAVLQLQLLHQRLQLMYLGRLLLLAPNRLTRHRQALILCHQLLKR